MIKHRQGQCYSYCTITQENEWASPKMSALSIHFSYDKQTFALRYLDIKNDSGFEKLIAKNHPEFEELMRWRGFDPDNMDRCIESAIRHAHGLDAYGLKAGELLPIISGPDDSTVWILPTLPSKAQKEKPNPVVLEWVPKVRRGEGGPVDLEKARKAVYWHDAPDEIWKLDQEALSALLEEEWPKIIEQYEQCVRRFKKSFES